MRTIENTPFANESTEDFTVLSLEMFSFQFCWSENFCQGQREAPQRSLIRSQTGSRVRALSRCNKTIERNATGTAGGTR